MEAFAQKIASRMKHAGELTDEQEEIIVYALMYLMLTVLSTLGILVLSWALGVFWPGVACAAVAATLRLMSGGAHYSTPVRCTLMSSVTFPVLALVGSQLPPAYSLSVGIAAVLFSLLFVALYAPVDNEARPIRSTQRAKFRIISMAVVLIWACVLFFTHQPAIQYGIALGLVWQTVSLTPWGHLKYHKLDQLLAVRR